MEISEQAYRFAYALAMTQHLFEVLPPSNLLPAVEEPAWAETIAQIQKNILAPLRDESLADDINGSRQNGEFLDLLCLNMEKYFIRTDLGLSALSDTNTLINRIEELENGSRSLYVELSKKLYVVARNAVSLTSEPDINNALTLQLVGYLRSLPENMGASSLVEGLDGIYTPSSEPLSYGVYNTAFRTLLHSVLSLEFARFSENNTSALSLRELGNNLVASSSYPQAIAAYTNALAVSSAQSSAQLYTNRAIAYIALNCHLEAVQDLNRAVTADCTFSPAWVQLGYCHLYMGLPEVSYRCYLSALKALAGEIYPTGFPSNPELLALYKEAKIATAMPQFVHRIIQAMILAEHRAKRQNVPSSRMDNYVKEAHDALALLSENAPTLDLHYLHYFADPDAENVRVSAVRSNISRPGIVIPGTQDQQPGQGATGAPPNDLRGLFNNLGDIVGGFLPGEPGADGGVSRNVITIQRGGTRTDPVTMQPRPVNIVQAVSDSNADDPGDFAPSDFNPPPALRATGSDFRNSINSMVPGLPRNLANLFSRTRPPTNASPQQVPTPQVQQVPTSEVQQVPTPQVQQVPTSQVQHLPMPQVSQQTQGRIPRMPTNQAEMLAMHHSIHANLRAQRAGNTNLGGNSEITMPHPSDPNTTVHINRTPNGVRTVFVNGYRTEIMNGRPTESAQTEGTPENSANGEISAQNVQQVTHVASEESDNSAQSSSAAPESGLPAAPVD